MTAQEYIITKLQELRQPVEFQDVKPDLLENTILAKVLCHPPHILNTLSS